MDMNPVMKASAVPARPAHAPLGRRQAAALTWAQRTDRKQEESLVRIAQAAFVTALALGALAFWLADK
jgi:hypothetical protein